jgi:hypothetical protein
MESGVIADADDTHRGSIAPDAGGNAVGFTAAVFQAAWNLAVPGLPVQFSRAPDGQRATQVVIAD